MTLPLMLAGVACERGGDGVGSPRQARLREAAQGLCSAEALARDGQVEAARSRFFDRSHAFLHELAEVVTRRDPTAAAALLEAKQRLESALDPTLDTGPTPDGPQVAGLVADLRAALGSAAGVVELAVPECATEEAA